MTSPILLDDLKRLKALADIGLLYNQNEYDRERYTEIQSICFDLLQKITDQPLTDLKISFPAAADYPTAKVDIRALILSADKKILLVKESADGRWSLPGGWADVGLSPREVVVKECKEETGLAVQVKALLAVFDKRLHPHPPQPFYVYKFIFLCEAMTGEIEKGHDVMDVLYFGIDALPELSTDRILESQVRLVYQKAVSSNFETYVD